MHQPQFAAVITIVNMCFDATPTQFTSLKQRLRTFTSNNWSKVQTPESLARAGFFRTQDAGHDDVQCFSCGIRIFDWDPTDEPLDEHIRWSQGCKFANLMQNLKQTRGLIGESTGLLELLEQSAQLNGADIAGNGEVAATIRKDIADRDVAKMLIHILYKCFVQYL